MAAHDPSGAPREAAHDGLGRELPCPAQFAALRLIINTTLCGDWAGAVYPGGPGRCVGDVAASDLAGAYWLIKYVKVYVKAGVLSASVRPVPFAAALRR